MYQSIGALVGSLQGDLTRQSKERKRERATWADLLFFSTTQGYVFIPRLLSAIHLFNSPLTRPPSLSLISLSKQVLHSLFSSNLSPFLVASCPPREGPERLLVARFRLLVHLRPPALMLSRLELPRVLERPPSSEPRPRTR